MLRLLLITLRGRVCHFTTCYAYLLLLHRPLQFHIGDGTGTPKKCSADIGSSPYSANSALTGGAPTRLRAPSATSTLHVAASPVS